MTALFERLLDWLVAWMRYLVPFYVLGDDTLGLVRRLGKYKRDLRPGWNWKWPVIEECLTESCALDSTVLREQTLTTRDGGQVTLRGVLAYRVVDARKYILGCATAESVVNDVGCALVAELIPGVTTEDVLSGKIDRDLTRRVKARARRWGIEVESFGLVDRVRTRTYRFIGSAPRDAV